ASTAGVAAWRGVGGWPRRRDVFVRERGDLPIESSAAEELRQRWKKIRKRGKTLARLNPRRRHNLRIQTKKLRYAAEFFAGVFPGKRAARRQKRFFAVLARLQDGLGEVDDIAVH